MVRLTFILLLSSLIVSSLATSCAEILPLRRAITESKGSEYPFAVATVIAQDIPADRFAKTTYTLRTEGCNNTVNATSGDLIPGSVTLKINSTYVLPLRKNGGTTHIQICGVVESYNSLSKEDRTFVDYNVPLRCRDPKKRRAGKVGTIVPAVVVPSLLILVLCCAIALWSERKNADPSLSGDGTEEETPIEEPGKGGE